MKKQLQILAAMALLLGSQRPSVAQQATTKPFELMSVRMEQNATDEDAEIVFEAAGIKYGLVQLTVVSPDGRNVIDFSAPAGSVGIRQFLLESPEPGDIASLKAAYPEGVYRFTGTTSTGTKLAGETKLSHALPPASSIVGPRGGSVAAEKIEINWAPVEGVAAYVVSIEQEEMNLSVEARLPATASRFKVPDGFALPGTAYKLAVGAVMASGNASFVEKTITTAAAAKKAP